jgi:hypothetical protein
MTTKRAPELSASSSGKSHHELQGLCTFLLLWDPCPTLTATYPSVIFIARIQALATLGSAP